MDTQDEGHAVHSTALRDPQGSGDSASELSVRPAQRGARLNPRARA